MTCFILVLRSGIELGLPVRCQLGGSALEWRSGGHPSSSTSTPEANVNPCLTQKVLVLDFLQFLSGESFCLLVLSLEAGFSTDPASGFSYPSLDAEWLLLSERLGFPTVGDVLIVARKSIPERNSGTDSQVYSVLYLVLIQVQDIEILTWT